MRRLAAAWVVAAMAVGLAGCGGKSPKATYKKMWKAAEAGDREACLACFTRACQAKMLELEKTAAELAEDKAGDVKVIDRIMAEAKNTICEIGEQKISGDTATLLVTINGKPQPARLVREDGAWKIDNSADLTKLERGLQFFKGLKGIKDAFEKHKKGK